MFSQSEVAQADIALADRLPVGVFVCDADGLYAYVNRRWSEVTGLSAEKAVPQGWIDVIETDDRRRVEEQWRKAVLSGIPFSAEYKCQRIDGSTVWVQSEAVAERNDAGDVVGFLGAIIDITGRKAVENENKWLKNLFKRAQKTEALGALASRIVHDFNNILGGIMGFSELAIREAETAGQNTENMERVLKSSARAKDLINQIVLYNTDFGSSDDQVRLNAVIEDTMKIIRAMVPATIEVGRSIARKPVTVSMPVSLVQQVLVNICVNSVQMIEPEKGRITIGLGQVKVTEAMLKKLSINGGPESNGAGGYLSWHGMIQPGDYAKMWIKDTGRHASAMQFAPAGAEMDWEDIPEDHTGEEGGLRMIAARDTILEHNGALRIESGPRRGTRYEVFLPLADTVGTAANSEESDEDVPTGHQERILCIDDEQDLVEIMCTQLSNIGYLCTGVSDAESALDTFRSEPRSWDLVITDQTMPGWTGMELAKEFHAIRPELPIIITSGFSMDIDRQIAREHGVKRFLRKPCSSSNLAHAVYQALDAA